jgi:hypothetical protein
VDPGWIRTIILLGSNIALLAATLLIMGRQFRKREAKAKAAGEAAIKRYYASSSN